MRLVAPTVLFLGLVGTIGATCAPISPRPPVSRPAPPARPPAGSPQNPPPASPAPTPAADPLLGHVTRAQLKAYPPWSLFWEQRYVPDAAAVESIKRDTKDITVLLVMGTWCPDSKRELPRYFATMDAAGIDDSKLTMIGVDRTKRDTEGVTDKFEITRVPTFIFLRGGKEVGRFVEHTPADSTFEAEMVRILRGGLRVASGRAGRMNVAQP